MLRGGSGARFTGFACYTQFPPVVSRAPTHPDRLLPSPDPDRIREQPVFPNSASAIRLVGAILADMHDEWQTTGRRYLSADFITQLTGQHATLAPAELTVGA